MRAGEIVGQGSSEEVLGARRAAGDGLGPVAGVPFAVKNLFACASRRPERSLHRARRCRMQGEG
jgi:hypothetical protein